MRELILAIFFATTAFGFLMQYLDYSKRNAEIPENVKDVYDKETYKKYMAYTMDNTKFSIISGIISTVIVLLMLLFNFHHYLYTLIPIENTIVMGLLIMFIPITIGMAVGSLLGIYSTFVIEARYGFNKTTPLTYIGDFFKGLILLVLIGGGLMALFLWLYGLIGNRVFFAFFFVFAAFDIFMNFISPLLIRVYYKLTPIEDGELKDKITALANKTDVKLKGIYIVNESKRSTRLNAFAAGFGKTKTIGLFDNLLKKFTDEEILAILAHEIGHEKKRHIIKGFPLDMFYNIVVVAFAYFIVTNPYVSMAFGFEGANLAFGIYALFILFEPFNLIFKIPENALSRKFEYEADAFECEHAGKEASISAIKKLYREDLGNLTPHPFVVKLYYTHPTASQRVAAFESKEL